MTQSYVALDENKRLSESIIWSLLEQFYDTASISAWDKIPFYPTSNPFIAETYAELILAFLKDLRPQLDSSAPFYIIEMAAGSGCFSYYLLKELKRKLTYFQDLASLRLVYIMTDFTASNVRTWQGNQKLRPFMEDGLLQLGVFRPESQETITLMPSGEVLSKDKIRNPVVAIANYFFDSIRQDAFQIQGGALKEVLHTFLCPQEHAGEPNFDTMVKRETYVDASFNYYEDEHLNQVLRQYAENLQDASVLVPIGAFDVIRNLLSLSGKQLVLLSSDKGFTSESYVKGHREQVFLPHHGVFSYSVNYDAIKKYLSLQGGGSFLTSDENLSVSTSASFLLAGLDVALEESAYYFNEKVDKQNVSNYLYFLQDILTATKPEKSNEMLRACMAFVQLCNFDPIVFSLAAPRIYAALETITSIQRERLLYVVERARENFYSVQQQFDVFYWAGRIYYGLDMVDEALVEFRTSLKIFGATSSALYYVAACHEIKKEFEEALSGYKETLKLEPECQYTKAGIQRMQEKLAAGAANTAAH